MAILCFLDTETGSAKSYNTALLQVSFILYDTKQRKFVGKFDEYLKPFDDDPDIEDGALKVNGINRDDIDSFTDPIEIQKKITDLLSQFIDRYDSKDKAYFIAYNSSFDHEVMMKWWSKCNKKTGKSKNYMGSFFWKQHIDVMCLANNFLIDKRPSMSNFKMGTVAEALEIPINESVLHNSIEDVKVMIKIYKKMGYMN